MSHSNLLGSDDVPAGAPGHDTRALGPSDSSDSGSDVAGLPDVDNDDIGLPVDIALADDGERPTTSAEALESGVDSDAGGTGERRSAGGDAGVEAADISPDKIVNSPNGNDFAEENSAHFILADRPDVPAEGDGGGDDED